MKKTKIEFQHFHGCPNSQKLWDNLIKAIDATANKDAFELNEIIVDTAEKAREIKFRGSPTILINGNDIADEPEPLEGNLACRYYSGLPDVELIKSKLNETLRK